MVKKQLEQMFKIDIRKICMLNFNKTVQVAAVCCNRRNFKDIKMYSISKTERLDSGSVDYIGL